jgi:hypothetical protein
VHLRDLRQPFDERGGGRPVLERHRHLAAQGEHVAVVHGILDVRESVFHLPVEKRPCLVRAAELGAEPPQVRPHAVDQGEPRQVAHALVERLHQLGHAALLAADGV